MARLADMTLQFCESLLNINPTVQIFTSYFFTDIPAAAGNANIFGNPTRAQVLAAYQSKLDQSKYGNGGIATGAVLPNAYPDPSTYSLGGKLSTNVSVPNGSAGQAPTNGISVTQASIAPTPQVLLVDSLVIAGVFAIPPSGNNYVENIKTATQVE